MGSVSLRHKALAAISRSLLPHGVCAVDIDCITMRVAVLPIPMLIVEISKVAVKCGLKSEAQIVASLSKVRISASARLVIDASIERAMIATLALPHHTYELSIVGVVAKASRESVTLRLQTVSFLETRSKATILGKVVHANETCASSYALSVVLYLSDVSGKAEIAHVALICRHDALVGLAKLAASMMPAASAEKTTKISAAGGKPSAEKPNILLAPLICSIKLSISDVDIVIPDLVSGTQISSLAGS